MKLLEAKLYNYKSITSAHIKVQPDITCLVGITGAGKTSILELLQKIDQSIGFLQKNLPEGGNTLTKFLGNEIMAQDILQIEAKFKIEDKDKVLLPSPYKNGTEVLLKMFFDGEWNMDITPLEDDGFEVDIKNEFDAISSTVKELGQEIRSTKDKRR